MLCLMRKVGESIVLDGHEVMVTKIVGKKVWLGVNAPANVPVNRKEVQSRVDAETVARIPTIAERSGQFT